MNQSSSMRGRAGVANGVSSSRSRRVRGESKTAAAPASRSSDSEYPPVSTQIVAMPARRAASQSQGVSPIMSAFAARALDRAARTRSGSASTLRLRPCRPGIGEFPGVELVVDEGVEVRLDRGTREDDRVPEVLQLRHQLVRRRRGAGSPAATGRTAAPSARGARCLFPVLQGRRQRQRRTSRRPCRRAGAGAERGTTMSCSRKARYQASAWW